MATNIRDKGLGRLAYQFIDSANFRAFIQSFLQEIQDLDGSAGQLLTERYLDTAVGAQRQRGRVAVTDLRQAARLSPSALGQSRRLIPIVQAILATVSYCRHRLAVSVATEPVASASGQRPAQPLEDRCRARVRCSTDTASGVRGGSRVTSERSRRERTRRGLGNARGQQPPASEVVKH